MLYMNYYSQFDEVNYYLIGLLGDVEQRHRHIAGDFVNQVLFPEVSYNKACKIVVFYLLVKTAI